MRPVVIVRHVACAVTSLVVPSEYVAVAVNWDELATNLIDVIVALWQAPVSS